MVAWMRVGVKVLHRVILRNCAVQGDIKNDDFEEGLDYWRGWRPVD